MWPRAGCGYGPFLNGDPGTARNHHSVRFRLLGEVLGQILGHHRDLVLWEGSPNIDHHMDGVLPSMLGIAGACHLAEFVTLHAIRLDRLLTVPVWQCALTPGRQSTAQGSSHYQRQKGLL